MTAPIATVVRPSDLGTLRSGIRHRTLPVIDADPVGPSEFLVPSPLSRLAVGYGRDTKLVFLTKRAPGELLHTVA